MKVKPVLLCVALSVSLECGQRTSETGESKENSGVGQKGGDETEGDEAESPAETLTILGDDIWIRDQPGTGEVVFKLNNADRCKVIGYGAEQFEVIRGDPDYWYKIEVDQKEGWVFGSQTDKAFDIEPLTAATPNELWSAFKNYYKKTIDQLNRKKIGEDYGTNSLEFSNDANFKIHYAIEGTFECTYSFPTQPVEDVVLISRNDYVAGADANHFSFTYVGIKLADSYVIYPEQTQYYDGALKDLVKVGPGEYLLLLRQSTTAPPYKHDYFNVVYINSSEQTIRKVLAGIGYAGTGFSYTDSLEPGQRLTLSSDAQLSAHGLLTVTEYRSEKQSDESMAPSDTLKTVYTWNKRSKIFKAD